MIDFGALPPEINSARMYAGPGSGPMLAAAAAWDGLAAQLHSGAAAYTSVISELTSGWQGPSSTAMAAAAAPYAAWMSTTAGQAELAATQAQAAAGAHEAAFAATVHPAVVAANRAQLMTLVATNLFGQNTPAIATTEAQYGEMWAQDAAAMYGYAASSAATTAKVTPFTAAPQTTSTAGLAAQATAAAQTTGTSTSAGVQSTLSQLISTVQTALQNLASPLSSALGGSSSSTTTGSPIPGLGGFGRVRVLGRRHRGKSASRMPSAPEWLGIGMANTVFGSAVRAPYRYPYEYWLPMPTTQPTQPPQPAPRPRARRAAAPAAAGSGFAGGFGGLPGLGGLAGTGQAASVGGLSVPPNWGWAATAPRGAAGVGAAADAGCAVGGQRSWRRIWFPIHARRAGAGRSGGRCWGRRGRCCYEIPATP